MKVRFLGVMFFQLPVTFLAESDGCIEFQYDILLHADHAVHDLDSSSRILFIQILRFALHKWEGNYFLLRNYVIFLVLFVAIYIYSKKCTYLLHIWLRYQL